MNKICQRQEYICRYGYNLPDERMLEIIDMDVIEKFREEVIRLCEQIRIDFPKKGEDCNNVSNR